MSSCQGVLYILITYRGGTEICSQPVGAIFESLIDDPLVVEVVCIRGVSIELLGEIPCISESVVVGWITGKDKLAKIEGLSPDVDRETVGGIKIQSDGVIARGTRDAYHTCNL